MCKWRQSDISSGNVGSWKGYCWPRAVGSKLGSSSMSDIGMKAFHQNETLMIAEEILLRRIKNRERQRRYRERKRLESDMKKSHLIEHHLSCSAETPPNTVYETRVPSGRKWKKEARRVYFSTGLENLEFEDELTVAELASNKSTNQSGRRDWKADARKKMEFEGGEALGSSVWF